tara:strand:- start:475 stop:867 length:393 start_codon:yes stop_codon:yes gene_type:complete
MKISQLIVVKAWLTIGLGLLFLCLPAQLFSWLGGDLGAAGTVMAQLFGLLAIAVGWGMRGASKTPPAGTEALTVALCDSLAVLLLVLATSRGVFAAQGYILAAVYVGSAVLYLFLFFGARSAQNLNSGPG